MMMIVPIITLNSTLKPYNEMQRGKLNSLDVRAKLSILEK